MIGRSSSDPSAHGGSLELRSFGRRRGRKPSARQAMLLQDVLPNVALDLSSPAPLDASELFSPPARDVWLEIGFGGGEHLLWQARRNPTVGLIGCEPFQDGVLKMLDALSSGGSCNIRLIVDDVRPLLRWLPAASIGRIFILFPDPWPKLRHRKRRLINAPFLDLLARIVRANGELRVASDVGDYVGMTLEAISRQGAFLWTAEVAADWRERPPDWPPTRYEAKANQAGRRCYYLTFRRRADG